MLYKVILTYVINLHTSIAPTPQNANESRKEKKVTKPRKQKSIQRLYFRNAKKSLVVCQTKIEDSKSVGKKPDIFYKHVGLCKRGVQHADGPDTSLGTGRSFLDFL